MNSPGPELDPDKPPPPISDSFRTQVRDNLKKNLMITLVVLAVAALIYVLFVWMT